MGSERASESQVAELQHLFDMLQESLSRLPGRVCWDVSEASIQMCPSLTEAWHVQRARRRTGAIQQRCFAHDDEMGKDAAKMMPKSRISQPGLYNNTCKFAETPHTTSHTYATPRTPFHSTIHPSVPYS